MEQSDSVSFARIDKVRGCVAWWESASILVVPLLSENPVEDHVTILAVPIGMVTNAALLDEPQRLKQSTRRFVIRERFGLQSGMVVLLEGDIDRERDRLLPEAIPMILGEDKVRQFWALRGTVLDGGDADSLDIGLIGSARASSVLIETNHEWRIVVEAVLDELLKVRQGADGTAHRNSELGVVLPVVEMKVLPSGGS